MLDKIEIGLWYKVRSGDGSLLSSELVAGLPVVDCLQVVRNLAPGGTSSSLLEEPLSLDDEQDELS